MTMALVDTSTQPKPRRKRSKKLPRHNFDRRTRVGQRALALAEVFRQRLGSAAADAIVAIHIQRAAQLLALSELLAGRVLNHDPKVSPDDAIRAARASDLALRRLRLERVEVKPTASPSVDGYIEESASNDD